jgi:hypothetical protein
VIKTVLVPTDQTPKQLLYIPALLLLGFIYMLQRRRRQPLDNSPAAEGETA